ncbi:uncharacterized protein LOC143624274 [Bidens hawaiensis]|uniref:uncharacterized protein LOC143624274 n=1 Tax=Bidens hawaiensis TaxID=980011 RepID=UPI00404A01E0
MGNCQAIDNASLVIQHPNGKAERLYAAISAAEVMKLNPGNYVALLLTTTLYSSRTPAKQNNSGTGGVSTNAQPLRVTRIKLLRPTESLSVGHIYRLITTQEVMKGLMAKKNGKISDYMKKPVSTEELAGRAVPAAVTVRSNHHSERTHHQMKKSENNPRTASPAPANSSAAAMRPRGWHPSLNSISETSS